MTNREQFYHQLKKMNAKEQWQILEDGRAVKRFYTQHSKGVTVRPASDIFQPNFKQYKNLQL